MFADEYNEDRMFTRAKWRMAIAQDARVPGYEQWVHLMKSFLEYFPEPQPKTSSSPSDVELCRRIQIAEDLRLASLRYAPLMSD